MSGHLGNLSNVQEQALQQLKQRVFTLEDASMNNYARKFCDDDILLRFLRARRFVVDDAFTMLVSSLQFRMSFQGKGVDAITLESVANEVRQGKSFYHNQDREGRPICIIKTKNHEPSKTDPLEAQRFSIFMIEYGRTMITPPVDTVTLLFDMSDAGMKNMDMKSLQFTIQMLQNYYPESLGRVLIYNSSWVVHGVWKVVKPWLDAVTAAKVFFVDKKNIQTYISPDQLLSEYGGRDHFKYDMDVFRNQAMQHIVGQPRQ